MIGRSGNPEFDYAVAQTLSRMTDLFDVLPGFAYFKVGRSRNAYAARKAFLSNPDGTIIFGRDLLFEIMNYLESPDAAFSAVCAHEFGHIVQFKRGISLDPYPFVKRSELHADFLSGYYAGRRKLQKPDFPAAVFASIYHDNFGDHWTESPDHHGTPQERASAIIRGFESAYRERQSTAEAIESGINYVSQF
jgi:predicted metalloprotease